MKLLAICLDWVTFPSLLQISQSQSESLILVGLEASSWAVSLANTMTCLFLCVNTHEHLQKLQLHTQSASRASFNCSKEKFAFAFFCLHKYGKCCIYSLPSKCHLLCRNYITHGQRGANMRKTRKTEKTSSMIVIIKSFGITKKKLETEVIKREMELANWMVR